jgi:membrane-bound serine protease (ClpP class)
LILDFPINIISTFLKKFLSTLLLLTLAGTFGVKLLKAEGGKPLNSWLKVKIGIIGTASEDILHSAIEEAKSKKFNGIIIELDTPGGALENTRQMVKAMMAAPFPVIVWVGPSGSHAGSAGAFITLAANFAAMAPGTNIGAAHPIQANGKDIEEGEASRKVLNDTLAFIESIADARGRNIEMARSFVATSISITAEEALKNKVIDAIEPTIVKLMQNLDGTSIKMNSGSSSKISATNINIVEYKKSLRQKALEILSNPNLFYLLFMAGMIGIGYELTHPGIMFPGIAGGICMILAFIAMSILPVSIGAAALIIFGIALLIAESFVTSFGILGISGFTAFVLGSIFLVDPNNEQGLRISLWTIAPGSVVVGVAFLALGYLVLKATNMPVRSGGEAMVGKTGTVITDFAGATGQIRLAGAIWKAEISGGNQGPLIKGDQVIVNEVNGLVVNIEKKS